MAKVERRFTMSLSALSVAIGAVYRAASEDESREHVHSVHIDRDGAALRFIATNGHWLAIYTTIADGPPCDWSATIRLSDAIAIMKRKTFGEVSVDCDAKLATFVDGTLRLNVVECSYPPWRDVYAKEEDKEARATIGMNPLYMARIHESFTAIVGKPKKRDREGLLVCIEPGKKLGPMRVTCSAAPELEIILMPGRQPPTPWTLGRRESTSVKKAV